MRPSTVKIIIIVSIIALLGLVFTQSMWMHHEILLSKKQFDHRADNALMDVIEELKNSTNGKHLRHYRTALIDSQWTLPTVNELDTLFLEDLMRKYVNYHMLDDNYYYAVVKTVNDSFVYCSEGFPTHETLSHPYKACLSCVFKDDYYHLALFFPSGNKAALQNQIAWLALTLLFLTIISSAVILIIITYLRQKKLSEMKNDFINNVTHEFKTPVSTIGLATEMLMNLDPALHHEKIKNYSAIIHDENERMRKQVERVLEVARQDHHKLSLNKQKIDLHKLIYSVVPNICLEKSEDEVKINYNLEAADPEIVADPMFITNIVTNITENAVKYTGDTPELIISTANQKEGILLSFKDNGIGISRDTIKHIFNKFYRVPTGDIHNVKGFGLGLYYAKVMVEAHGGYINVSSELNKGSSFDVYLPRMADERKGKSYE